MKKTILTMSLLVGALAISSCSKNEEVQEPQIIQSCSGLVCSFAIEDDTLDRFTNLLGKSIDRVVKRTQLIGEQDQVTWNISGAGQVANTTQLMDRDLTPCVDDTCTLNSNPTGWVFTSTDSQEVSVSGTIINADGTTREINKETYVDLSIGTPIVTIAKVNAGELEYTFTADPDGTGIPDNATYTWTVDGGDASVGLAIIHTFANAGTDHEVKLIVSSPDLEENIEVVNTITSGAIAPTVVEDSVNGKSVTLTANMTDTGLPAGTALTWSVAGQTITAVGSVVTFELPSYSTAYDIAVTATAPGASSGIQSSPLSVTTGFGKPVIIPSVLGGSGTDYNFTANIEDTGIIAGDATFTWTFDDGSTATGLSVNHDFGTSGQHTASLSVVPTSGATPIVADTVSITVGAPDIPNLISVQTSNNPLNWRFTADLTDTGIDNTWSKAWAVDSAAVEESTNILTHTFDLTSTAYTVTFTATKGGITRTATENFTTGDAVTPVIKVDSDAGGATDNNVYNVSVDLTDTGITAAWTLAWMTGPDDPGTTFAPADAAISVATFSEYDTTYTVTLTATPPAGSSVSTVVTTGSVVVGNEPLTYGTSASFKVPSKSQTNAASMEPGINGVTGFADSGLATVTVSSGKINYTCKPGYYITNEAIDTYNGRSGSNEGPNEEVPKASVGWLSQNQGGVFTDKPYKGNGASAYNNNSAGATLLGCWELKTS